MTTLTITGSVLAASASTHLNYLGILLAGVANFALGGLWYSPVLFAKPWMKAAKLNPKKMNMEGVGGMYALAVVTALVVPLSLAYLLKLAGAADTLTAVRIGLTAWLGFTVAATAGDYAFLRRGFALNAINNGLHLCTFTLSAVILSLWR